MCLACGHLYITEKGNAKRYSPSFNTRMFSFTQNETLLTMGSASTIYFSVITSEATIAEVKYCGHSIGLCLELYWMCAMLF